MNNVIVTKHARERMRKRTGINKNSVQRMAEIVFDSGKRFNETKGRLHRYLEDVDERNEEDKELVIYGNNLYIFRENNLITVWSLPGILPAS